LDTDNQSHRHSEPNDHKFQHGLPSKHAFYNTLYYHHHYENTNRDSFSDCHKFKHKLSDSLHNGLQYTIQNTDAQLFPNSLQYAYPDPNSIYGLYAEQIRHFHTNSNPDRVRHSLSDNYPDSLLYRNRDSDGHSDALFYRDRIRNTDCDWNRLCKPYKHTNRVTDHHKFHDRSFYGLWNTIQNRHTDPFYNRDRHRNSESHGHRNSDTESNYNPDKIRNPNHDFQPHIHYEWLRIILRDSLHYSYSDRVWLRIRHIHKHRNWNWHRILREHRNTNRDCDGKSIRIQIRHKVSEFHKNPFLDPNQFQNRNPFQNRIRVRNPDRNPDTNSLRRVVHQFYTNWF